jgi:solute:Na+ symporter, SSS family
MKHHTFKYQRIVQQVVVLCLLAITMLVTPASARASDTAEPAEAASLDWQSLPDFPDSLGVAGPLVGVHNDALIVAGGANFPKPVWDNDKVWHSAIHVLVKTKDGYAWHDGGQLPHPLAYGAAVSTPDGVICMGGNDSKKTFDDVFLLSWDSGTKKVTRRKYPSLPKPCVYGQATLVGNKIYLAGGQSSSGLDSAMNNFWVLDLSKKDDPAAFVWKELDAWPGATRSFNITVHQHNGYNDCIYVMSGRR